MSLRIRNTLSILFLLVCLNSYSQTKDSISNPLEKFFHDNFDSTIFYHTFSYFKNNPDFYIVGKKDDTIYYYHYDKHPTQEPSKLSGPFKSGLQMFFVNRFINNRRFSKIYPKIDLDDNFFWVNTEVSKGSLWERIQTENLWNFIDDRSELLKKEPLKYQKQVINTMYNRSKYHPNQTKDMKEAMKIFLEWIQEYQ